MYVPSYQMHNVLNVYSKQLRQNMAMKDTSKPPGIPRTDRVNLTPEAKRQATIEKVSQDILNKISRYGSLNETRQRMSDQPDLDSDNPGSPHRAVKKTFVFNAIDTINNQKRTNTLSVDDSSFLLQRLEQLAKKAGDKEPESWI